MGANVLYIYDAHTTDNKFGSEFESGQTTRTILSGIAYSNDIPNIDDFKNRLGNKKKFKVKKKVSMSKRSSDYSIYNQDFKIKIDELYEEDSLIFILCADICNKEKIRIVTVNENDFSVM